MKFNGRQSSKGDRAAISDEKSLLVKGEKEPEVLLFDLGWCSSNLSLISCSSRD